MITKRRHQGDDDDFEEDPEAEEAFRIGNLSRSSFGAILEPLGWRPGRIHRRMAELEDERGEAIVAFLRDIRRQAEPPDGPLQEVYVEYHAMLRGIADDSPSASERILSLAKSFVSSVMYWLGAGEARGDEMREIAQHHVVDAMDEWVAVADGDATYRAVLQAVGLPAALVDTLLEDVHTVKRRGKPWRGPRDWVRGAHQLRIDALDDDLRQRRLDEPAYVRELQRVHVHEAEARRRYAAVVATTTDEQVRTHRRRDRSAEPTGEPPTIPSLSGLGLSPRKYLC